MNMHVVVLIDAWFSITGGGQVYVREIAKRLKEKYDCNIEVVTSRLGNKKPQDFGFKVVRLGPPWSFENPVGRIVFLILATVYLLQNNYDLISAQAFLPGIPAKIANFLKKTPVVFTVHGVIGDSWPKLTNKISAKIYSVIEKKLLFGTSYDHQISVSSDFLKYKNVNQNIEIIGNGVDLESFESVRTKKDKTLKILFVGRLHPQKGLFYLVDAISQIIKKDYQFQVILVGEGPIEDKLKSYLKKQNLDRYFIFKGLLTGTKLISEYKSSHLFVLPSVYEGFPLTLLEAWAAKLPIVATSVGENSRLVKNGVNGILVEPGDSKALANALILLIKNKKRNKLGEAGYKIAREYTWDKIVDKTFTIFRKVAK